MKRELIVITLNRRFFYSFIEENNLANYRSKIHVVTKFSNCLGLSDMYYLILDYPLNINSEIRNIIYYLESHNCKKITSKEVGNLFDPVKMFIEEVNNDN